MSHPIDNKPGKVPIAKAPIVAAPSQKFPVVAAYACAIIVNPQGTKNVAQPVIADSIIMPLSSHRLRNMACMLLGKLI